MSNVAEIVGGIPALHVMVNNFFKTVSVLELNPERLLTRYKVTMTLIDRSVTGTINELSDYTGVSGYSKLTYVESHLGCRYEMIDQG